MDQSNDYPLPFPRKGISLQLTVLAAFLLIYVPAIFAITYFNHISSRARAETDVSEQIESMASRIVERQQRYFQPAADWATVWARRMGGVNNPVIQAPSNLPSALEMLARNPQFYSVNVGKGPNQLFHVSRIIPGGNYGVTADRLPREADYTMWLIDRTRGLPEKRWFFDASFRPLSEDVLVPTGSNPASRPWYKAAMKTSEVAVEGPFNIITGQRMGITFSRRFSRDQDGVVSVSVLVGDFAAFLQENRVGKLGYTVVFNSLGEAVAIGDPSGQAMTTFARSGLDQALPALTDSTVPAIQWLGGNLPKSGERRQADFKVAGQQYRVLMVPLKSPFQGDLHLGLIVSMNEFLDPINKETAITALLSLGIGALAVPLIFWLAFQISRPIQRLTEESVRVARLDFSHSIKTHSPITEVRQLFEGFSAMTTGLGAFTKFVPRNVVEEVLQTQRVPAPGGEARNISILFTDVEDFTRLAEGMSPSDLFRKATSYYGEVGSPILASGGVIGRFMGDGIVAFWNAPQPDAGYVEKAAFSALQSRAQSEALNARWRGFGWPVMRTRFGLHVGDAIIGNIGLPDRLEYSALGDSLNVASRLEGLNKVYGTQILVSDAVANALPPGFILRQVDRVMPKGTSIAFGIHELIGMLDGEEGLAPTDAQVEAAAFWNHRVVPAYLAQDWETVITQARAYLHLQPEDRVARIYISRAEQYRAVPPAPGWDGVEHFTVK